MDTHTNVQPEFGTQEWVDDFIARVGIPPMAGAEGEAGSAPAAVEGSEGEGSDEGQGGSDEGLGLYDLDSVDPAYRDDVAAALKEIEGNVTRKFQEHSELRNKIGPYENLGIFDQDPENVANLLAFAEIAEDEEAFKEWWNEIGDRFGFAESDDDDDEDEEFSFDDDDDSDDEDLAEQLSEVVANIVEERLAPIEQRVSAQQEAEMVSQVEQQIEDAFKSLHDEHGEFDDDIVTRFALAYPGDPEAIQKGFTDYQQFVGSTKRDTITSKANGSGPVDGPGKPNTNAQKPATIEDAGRALAERLQAGASS
jgi:uncharacterized protein YdcH (DUF465 family)